MAPPRGLSAEAARERAGSGSSCLLRCLSGGSGGPLWRGRRCGSVRIAASPSPSILNMS